MEDIVEGVENLDFSGKFDVHLLDESLCVEKGALLERSLRLRNEYNTRLQVFSLVMAFTSLIRLPMSVKFRTLFLSLSLLLNIDASQCRTSVPDVFHVVTYTVIRNLLEK